MRPRDAWRWAVPPAATWARRRAELGGLALDLGRLAIALVFGPMFLVVGIVGIVLARAWADGVLYLALGAFGCWAVLKALDARVERRSMASDAMHGPELAAVALRYRLQPDPTGRVPEAALAARMLSRPFGGRMMVDVLAAYGGTLQGRSVLVLRLVGHHHPDEVADLVLVSCHREGRLTVTPAFGDETSDPPTFAEVAAVTGGTVEDLGPQLVAWLPVEASAFAFEVVPGWVVGQRRWPHGTLGPEQLGVWLAAVLGFAERWDADRS